MSKKEEKFLRASKASHKHIKKSIQILTKASSYGGKKIETPVAIDRMKKKGKESKK